VGEGIMLTAIILNRTDKLILLAALQQKSFLMRSKQGSKWTGNWIIEQLMGNEMKRKGWGWVIKGRKRHYFDNKKTSLCGKYPFRLLKSNLYDTFHWAGANCKICALIRLKKEEKRWRKNQLKKS